MREAKPDFFEALYYFDEGNKKEARKYAEKVLDNLDKVFKNQPNNKYLKLFFDAHYKDLAQLFKGDAKSLQQLEIYDPLHKGFYKEYMKM